MVCAVGSTRAVTVRSNSMAEDARTSVTRAIQTQQRHASQTVLEYGVATQNVTSVAFATVLVRVSVGSALVISVNGALKSSTAQ